MDTVKFVRFSDGVGGIILAFAPLLVAKARGYFEKFGIDLQLVEPKTSYGWHTLLAGEADIGAGYFAFCGEPHILGKIKAVAVNDDHRPGHGFTSLMARTALIETGELNDDCASIKGKRIGLLPGRGDDYMHFHGPLMQAGLTMDDVEIVPVSHAGSDRPNALARGEVDIVIVRRPRHQLGALRSGVLKHWKRGHEIFPYQQSQFLLGRTGFLDERPDVAQRWFQAWLMGARDYLTEIHGPDRAKMVDLLVEQSDDDHDTVDAMWPCWYKPDGGVDLKRLAVEAEILRAAGLLTKDVPEASLIDNRAIDGAARALGPWTPPQGPWDLPR